MAPHHSPYEQLLQPLLNGAVRVGAFAEVLDRIHARLELVAATGHAREPSDDLHLVTVVQRTRIPDQVAVTAVVPVSRRWDEVEGSVTLTFRKGLAVPREGAASPSHRWAGGPGAYDRKGRSLSWSHTVGLAGQTNLSLN